MIEYLYAFSMVCTYGTPTVQVADFSSQCNDSVVLLQERMAGDVKLYNEIIQHETLRVAVCDMLGGGCSCPDTLRFWILSILQDCYLLNIKKIFSCITPPL